MSLTAIRNHVDQGLHLFLDEYKNRPRLGAWLTCYLQQVQDLEDAAYDVLIKRLIDQAQDAQLDGIGAIVGEPRLGRIDEEYRLFIFVRIVINRSHGSPLDILTVTSMITSPTPARFNDYYPGAFLLEFMEETSYDPRIPYRYLQQTRSGGIRMNYVAPTTTPDMQFRYSSVGDVNVGDNGYGDAAHPNVFGLLSWAIGPETPLYMIPGMLDPRVDSVTPNSASQAGGPITVRGANFPPLTATTVKVGGAVCSDVVWVNSGQITCNVPPGLLPGVYDVTVSGVGFTSGSSGTGLYQTIGVFTGKLGTMLSSPANIKLGTV